MFELQGRVALITGAGQGIGADIARTFARQGAAIAVNDVVVSRATAVADELRSSGAKAVATPFDVGNLDHVRAGVTTIEAELGPIDILVNNAGIPASMRPATFRDLAPDEWDAYLDVNLRGVLNCSKAVLDGMCTRGFGRVITISSAAGVVGVPMGVSLYGAGKGGALAFSRHLAMEVAKDGVTSNSVALALFDNVTDDAVLEARTQSVPIGRLGTGADAAYACVYLASDEAAWVTGQTIHVNGGVVTT